jgi:2-polyprenyl-3-methyl-5-hydroxy-6-metoxy-1,4-benzoquinol methylase
VTADESSGEILRKNQEVWGDIFHRTDPAQILDRIRDPQATLKELETSSIGAECTWSDELLTRLKGANVLEIGAGSGETAAMMLGLGADRVTATEITEDARELMEQVAEGSGFGERLQVHIGDFLTMDLGPAHSYDLVVLREVLHHIPTEIEDEFVARTAYFLKPDGMTQFKDPAVNSRVLDEIRWAVPTPGRPSKLFQKEKFAQWRARDAHPIRDNSTKHYTEIMSRHYGRVDSFVLGSVSRFHRLVDSDKYHDPAMRRLTEIDRRLPQGVQRAVGSVQRLSCYEPLR